MAGSVGGSGPAPLAAVSEMTGPVSRALPADDPIVTATGDISPRLRITGKKR